MLKTKEELKRIEMQFADEIELLVRHRLIEIERIYGDDSLLYMAMYLKALKRFSEVAFDKLIDTLLHE